MNAPESTKELKLSDEDEKVMQRSKHIVWKIAPIVATTDQLPLGGIVFITKFANPDKLRGDTTEVSNTLNHIGISGSDMIRINSQLAHLSDKIAVMHPELNDARKEIRNEIISETINKVPCITGMCADNLELHNSHKMQLRNSNIHAIIHHSRIHIPNQGASHGIIGITSEDILGKKLSSEDYDSIRTMVSNTVKKLGFIAC